MRYNEVIELEVVTDLATEPVTLAEQKAHMNMFFETSGAYDFTDDNNYITNLIITARQLLEKYTGLSFGTKTLRAILRNECGGQEIPAGPNIVVTSVKDIDGNTYAVYTSNTSGHTYRLSGNQYKSFISPFLCYLDVSYTAGYGAGKLPYPLKQAIMMQVQFMYDNRGSQQQNYAAANVDLCKSALELAAPYKKTSFLV